MMEHPSKIDHVHHVLSSLIIRKLEDEVAIDATELAAMAGVEISTVIENGDDIAKQCTRKFETDPQPRYDWSVTFAPETQYFIAIRPQRQA